jgi:hypothetical protein
MVPILVPSRREPVELPLAWDHAARPLGADARSAPIGARLPSRSRRAIGRDDVPIDPQADQFLRRALLRSTPSAIPPHGGGRFSRQRFHQRPCGPESLRRSTQGPLRWAGGCSFASARASRRFARRQLNIRILSPRNLMLNRTFNGSARSDPVCELLECGMLEHARERKRVSECLLDPAHKPSRE